MNKIKHIIFDLDYTLWDFNRNSKETLELLFKKHSIAENLKTTFHRFLDQYYTSTNALWLQYDNQEITKQELRDLRFPKVFSFFKFVDDSLAKEIEDSYLKICPNKTHLIDGAKSLLDYLVSKKYTIHLLTNGFKDIQHKKLIASNINHYFENIVTSECSGYSKPDKRAFEYLLSKIDGDKNECIMIGDNLQSDIEGSTRIGMCNIYLNPEKSIHEKHPTFEVQSLQEI